MFRAAKNTIFTIKAYYVENANWIIKNQLGIDFHFKVNLLMLTSPKGEVVK